MKIVPLIALETFVFFCASCFLFRFSYGCSKPIQFFTSYYML